MPIRFRSRQQKCRIGLDLRPPAGCARRSISGEMPRAGPRAVGNVDGVDAALVQGFALGHRVAQVVAARRHQFHGRDPLAVGQPAGQPRFLGQAARAAFGSTAGRLAITVGCACARRERLDGQGDLADMVGRGAATAAHGRSAQAHVTLGIGRPDIPASRSRSGGSPLPWACPALGCTINGSGVSRTAVSTAPSKPVGPDAAVHAPGDRLRAAGGQRGQHPLDRLARGRFARARRWRRKARRARPGNCRMAAAQRSTARGWAASRRG